MTCDCVCAWAQAQDSMTDGSSVVMHSPTHKTPTFSVRKAHSGDVHSGMVRRVDDDDGSGAEDVVLVGSDTELGV